MRSRAQNVMWRMKNRRETFPKELWASDLEALEVSGTTRGDQTGLMEVCKSPHITIFGVCRVSMRASKEFLENQNDVQSIPGELHRGFEEL